MHRTLKCSQKPAVCPAGVLNKGYFNPKKKRRQGKIKWPEVLLSLSGGKGPVQGSRWSLKSPTKEAQPRTRWFSGSDSSKTLLRFLKEGVRDHSVPPLSHTSPPILLLSTSPSLGAICCCRLYNCWWREKRRRRKDNTHIRKWSRPRIEMEELKEERGIKREGPMCGHE